MRLKQGTGRWRFVLAILFVAGLLSGILVVAYANFGSTIVKADNAPDTIDAMPILPDATNQKYIDIGSNAGKVVTYDIQLPSDQTIGFYEAHMKLQGWANITRSSYFPNEVELSGVWSDKQDILPYTLDLRITAQYTLKVLPVVGVPTTHVNIDLSRLPVLNKTPAYPGAEHVQTKRQTTQISVDDWLKQTLITFQTPATRTQIEDYYKTVLSQYGWNLMDREAYDIPTNTIIKGSLLFTWHRGGPEESAYGASVVLIIVEHSGGPSTVELRLTGTNKYEP